MSRILDSIFNDTPRAKDYTMFELQETYPIINTAPSYQRKPRHSQVKMSGIISHVMRKGFFLPIVLYRYQPGERIQGFIFECVDGQHRLFVIDNFRSGTPVTVKGKTFMITWDYEDPVSHHIIHVFYEENNHTQKWILEHKDMEFSYMTEEEKKRFNQYRLSALIFEEPMAPDQRRMTFLKLQEGVPVRNSDLYKNHTHLKLISFITDTMGWASKMTECIDSHVTTRPLDYWLPWVIRLFLIHTGDDYEKDFMILDSTIISMIKNNDPRLNIEPSDDFKNDMEEFFEIMEDTQEEIKFNPCQFYAIFTQLYVYNSNKIILKSILNNLSNQKRYNKLWQKDTKGIKAADRRDYYIECMEEIGNLMSPKPLYKSMTTSEYRKYKSDIGDPVKADQDVCHIIADTNGGANHSANYIILSRTPNRSIGRRNDAYFAKLAGLEKTREAVEISKKLTGYSGPSAEELCNNI